MQVNNALLKLIATGIIILGVIATPFYFAYTIFFSSTVEVGGYNPGLFGPRMQQASQILSAAAASKMSFKQKDLLFTQSPLYKSFVDPPEVIPLSDSRGRPDPFVPYVAP